MNIYSLFATKCFAFCAYEALDSKRVFNESKAITSFVESVDLAVFSWGACRITSSLFSSFISPTATVIELIINFSSIFRQKR